MEQADCSCLRFDLWVRFEKIVLKFFSENWGQAGFLLMEIFRQLSLS